MHAACCSSQASGVLEQKRAASTDWRQHDVGPSHGILTLLSMYETRKGNCSPVHESCKDQTIKAAWLITCLAPHWGQWPSCRGSLCISEELATKNMSSSRMKLSMGCVSQSNMPVLHGQAESSSRHSSLNVPRLPGQQGTAARARVVLHHRTSGHMLLHRRAEAWVPCRSTHASCRAPSKLGHRQRANTHAPCIAPSHSGRRPRANVVAAYGAAVVSSSPQPSGEELWQVQQSLCHLMPVFVTVTLTMPVSDRWV